MQMWFVYVRFRLFLAFLSTVPSAVLVSSDDSINDEISGVVLYIFFLLVNFIS